MQTQGQIFPRVGSMVDKLTRGTWVGGEGAELSLNDLLLQGDNLKAAKLIASIKSLPNACS